MKKKKKPFKKTLNLFIIFILLPCIVLLYSHYIGTTGLITNEYKIKNDNFYGLKIVQISDIHYGKMITKKELKSLVKKVNLTKPDIVVFTGDLIDKNTTINDTERDMIISILAKIDSNMGSYYIKGDHDNNDTYKFIMDSSGFIDLDNSYDLIYNTKNEYIMLAGISSHILDKNIDEKMKNINQFLNENKPNYSILIMHEPDVIDNINYSKFNLVLAGHSLNGQVKIPFIGGLIKPNYGKKYYDTKYQLKNTTLFVSGGIGIEDYQFRLFNRPSINLYRLSN